MSDYWVDIKNKPSVVALLLMLATLLSWLIFEGFHGRGHLNVLIVAIAIIKVKAISRYFMGTAYIPGPWNMMMNIWLGAVFTLMVWYTG